METVLITGGSGLIGRKLSAKLQETGYNVAWLSRKPESGTGYRAFGWDPATGIIDPEAIASVDYLVHLAGANIGAARWTGRRKKIIVESRVKTTGLLVNSFSRSEKLKAFITASATGWYGAVTSEKIFSEEDPPANDFLGQTCRLWEEAATGFERAGYRTVKIRTGIVLSAGGGALEKMALPVRLGIGAALGSGSQYMPWVHIDDLCDIYLRAISDNTFSGPYNAVAPDHATGRIFVESIARALHKPLWFPDIPALALKIIFGEMAGMLTEGSRVSSEKLQKTRFMFRYPDLESALAQIYS